MSQPKVWGTTTEIIAGIHALTIKGGVCCSLHRHLKRANDFLVFEGTLLVEIEHDGLSTWHVLRPEGVLSVPVGTWHRFIGISRRTHAMEWYTNGYGKIIVEDSDIERRYVGHVLSDEELLDISRHVVNELAK